VSFSENRICNDLDIEKNNIPKDEESAKKWQELFAEKNIEAKVVDDAGENGMQGGKIFLL